MEVEFRNASDEDNKSILEGLREYNLSVNPSLPAVSFQKINLVIKSDQGEFIGGINAEVVSWGILFVALLFVKEAYRGKGYGAKLLNQVEKAAKEKGAYLAHLDTFDFQGKDFYLKQGYEIFGILNDCPKGSKRYYLTKRLA